MEDAERSSPAVNTTSPDLLKNTPSNIAGLEDVIEQCHGRQKYLTQTRSPSDGSDVRWYFCKVPLAENELAASVPRTDVVGKSEYFRFGMRDSLAIEASFLQREDELLSFWWKEYAECSIGPIPQVNSKKKSNKQSMETLQEASVSSSLYDVEEERVGVPVKGGLYEVDLVRRHCFPVYWNGDNRRVLRGHWFARKGGLDWLPIPETVAEQLEVAYRNKVWRRRRFQPSGLFAARVDLQGSSLGLHALFTGEDDTWEAWLNVDPSGFSGIVGYTGNGIKLRRGYAGSYSPKPTQEELRQQKEEEMDNYCSQVPVRHLVFMVHGIGQKVEKSNLVDDVGNFRQITAALGERHLTSHQRGTQRVLFIPCQWRKGLKLSGEAAVDKCTLEGVRRLREMLSATVHDVLYYMSPIYCQAIIDSVSNQLNRLYLKFIKRNPDYDGKISIYGHSLGSVLSYDILCHQRNLSSPFPMDAVYKRFFSDGISLSLYVPKRPVIVPYHRGGKRLHIGLQDFKEDFAARSHRVMNHFGSVRTRVLTICQSKSSDRLEESEETDDEKDGRSYGSLMMERFTGTRDGRIDHMLQDKTFEHPYLQAIGAHTNYWRDNDTALFIIKHLYRELPDEPNSPTESTDVNNTPKDSSRHHSWIDRSEADDTDEELPLTFSNKEITRSFSEEAKKYLKKP